MKSLILFFLLTIMPLVSAEELTIYHVAQVSQGETTTVMAMAQGIPGNVPVRLEATCCEVSGPGEILLESGKENVFAIRVHAGLTQTPGYYNLLLEVGNRTEVMGINVQESDLAKRLPGLEHYKESLQSVVDDYSDEGYTMSEAYVMLSDVSLKLAEAKSAVKEDDIENLEAKLLSVERKLYYEIPLKISSIKANNAVYGMVWAPIAVLVVGMCLVMLLLRSRT